MTTKQEAYHFVIKNYKKIYSQGDPTIQELLKSIREGLDIDFNFLIKTFNLLKYKAKIIPISYVFQNEMFIFYFYDKLSGLFEKMPLDKSNYEKYQILLREKKLNDLLN
jgi:hypothetical protein